MTVTTDHKCKPFKHRDEVPARILASEFDWTDGEGHYYGFLCYRGVWYHLSEFMTVDANSGALKGWHGYHGGSFFSGVVIKISNDGESYQIGRYRE